MRQAFAGLLGRRFRLTSRIQPQLGLDVSESFSLPFFFFFAAFVAFLAHLLSLLSLSPLSSSTIRLPFKFQDTLGMTGSCSFGSGVHAHVSVCLQSLLRPVLMYEGLCVYMA